jgi:DNA mismatch endonuclease (patch repair protein)
MADFLSPAQRSERMGRIRSKNTSVELALRSALHALGLRFRVHARELPGNPDILLPKYRTAIFVHGCFWHRHSGCKVATTPKSNTEFWEAKFDRNVSRDQETLSRLSALGWNVMIVWECELSSGVKAADTARRVRQLLTENLPKRNRKRGH